MNKKLILVLVFLFSAVSLCSADVIYLKSGKRIEGKIIERTPQQVKVSISGVSITYYADEIDRIEGSAPSATPSAAKPAVPASAQPAAVRTAPAAATPTPAVALDHKQLILSLIEVSGTRSAMREMFDQIIAEAPPQEAGKLKEVFNIDQIVTRLVPVYEKYFTDQDVQGLIDFYKSPLGKKLIRVTPLLMEDSMQTSLEYFKEKLPPDLQAGYGIGTTEPAQLPQ